MNPQIASMHRQEPLREDGMLFVRTRSIFDTMVNTPLVIACIIAVALTMSLQSSFGSTRMLDLTLYADGSTHISAQLDVDPLDPDLQVSLFGPSTDNFVAVGENGFLLSSEINGDMATIDTLGSSSIIIDYDIHDLTSKKGPIWTFTLDSPTSYTLLMPPNAIIVGMDALPLNLEQNNNQVKLNLNAGISEINYIFGAAPIVTPPTLPQNTLVVPPADPDNSAIIFSIVGVLAAAIAGAVIIIKRGTATPVLETTPAKSPIQDKPADTQIIFEQRPDMREDDKDIVKFISANGGQALESDLRKKFLQPKTTMWRAVKRLERQGVIEISKKDQQNLITLKKDLEEEN